jgi:hypothetical protein
VRNLNSKEIPLVSKSRLLRQYSHIGLHQMLSCLIILFMAGSPVLYSQTMLQGNLGAVGDPTNGTTVGGSKYYLSTTGDDADPGTIASPFATFSRFEAVMKAGDTLVVRAGTYHEFVTLDARSGTKTDPVVIMAYPGESPVLDGEKNLPGSAQGGFGLLHIRNNYFHVSGLEIKNSSSFGVYLGGTGNVVSDLIVHDTHSTGIYAGGDSSIVEDCLVYDVCLENFEGVLYDAYTNTPTGQWGIGIEASRGGYGESSGKDRITDYAIIRRNIVHDSWGEGISTYEARHTLIEDNIVYDSFATYLYISDAQYITARRNLVYGTKTMTGRSDRTAGLGISDEKFNLPSVCDTIVYNIVMGTGRCLDLGRSTSSLIANNTFINSVAFGTIMVWDGAGDWHLANNIVIQDSNLPVILLKSDPARIVTFSHNFWSKTPNSSAASPDDIVGDATLARTGSTAAGELSRHYFSLLPGSPAIGEGANVGLPYVGSAPDMGALEAGGIESTLPLPPAPNSPTIGALYLPTNPTLRWNASPGAMAYRLQVSTSPDFSTTVHDQSVPMRTSRPISGLANSTRYYWRVSAQNAGGISQWSQICNFTTSLVSKTEFPILRLSPKILDFGEVLVNQTQTLTVSFTNDGAETLHIANLAFPNSMFTASTTQFELAPGASFTNSISARAPATAGTVQDVAVIESNGASGPDTIGLKLVVVVTTDVDPDGVPATFALDQNYPNPFNPSTTIRYGLPYKSNTTLTVFSPLGQQVAVFQEGEQEAGYHEITLDASGLSSGTYFYRLQAGDFVQTRKLLLLR